MSKNRKGIGVIKQKKIKKWIFINMELMPPVVTWRSDNAYGYLKEYSAKSQQLGSSVGPKLDQFMIEIKRNGDCSYFF